MTIYPGVVTLNDDKFNVTVGFDDGRVHLHAGDQEIGDWADAECVITPDGENQWLIQAEDEVLAFTPDVPGDFARSFRTTEPPTGMETARVAPASTGRHRDPDTPRASTMIGFFMLATVTAVLGVWAFMSLFG